MSEDAKPKGPDPRHALLRERMRLAAERESVRARAREWRDRSDEERVRAFIEIMWTTAAILEAREQPYVKPPLPVRHFDSTRSAAHARR